MMPPGQDDLGVPERGNAGSQIQCLQMVLHFSVTKITIGFGVLTVTAFDYILI
jgi:hypothetical protein